MRSHSSQPTRTPTAGCRSASRRARRSTRRRASYIDALAAFNEGRAGTPHCDQLELEPDGPSDMDGDVDESIDEAMSRGRD
jgi:hypothetical protein